MNAPDTTATGAAAPARSGRLATAVGIILGAHLGIAGGAILGTFAYLPFAQEGTGGWDVLIGAALGAVAGVPLGGVLGCFAALRVRGHTAAGVTAGVTAAILVIGVIVMVSLFRLAQTADVAGGWFLVALEGPILAAAVLARRLRSPGD